jgi:chorismate mutase
MSNQKNKKANKNTEQELKRLRKKIDEADTALIRAFAARFDAVEKIGKLKKELKLQVIQKARWKELLADRLKRAKALGISGAFVREVFKAIHLEAIRIQKRRK